MKKLPLFFLGILSTLFFSSCSLEGFQASLLQDQNISFDSIQVPVLEIKKSKITAQFPAGLSFASFPLLAPNQADILAGIAGVKVWQKDKSENLLLVNAQESFFVEAENTFEVSWNLEKEEEKYNSLILNQGDSFSAIYRGVDPLKISDLKINGQDFSTQNIKIFFSSFLVRTSSSEWIDLVQKMPKENTEFVLGSGVFFSPKIFAKLSWPVSVNVQLAEEKIEALAQAQQQKVLAQQEKEAEKFQTNLEKLVEKDDTELAKKVFEETQDLTQKLLISLKNQDQDFFDNFTASRSLVAQVHQFSDIQNLSDSFNFSYWAKQENIQRQFKVLNNQDFVNINTANRAIIFVAFPFSKEEIDPETGILSFYKAFSFIRNKDCSWGFNPIQTAYLNLLIDQQQKLYSEKHFLEWANTQNLQLDEKEEFIHSRLACRPETKGITADTKGKFIALEESEKEQKPASKLLKDLENKCGDFSEIVSKIKPQTLKNFIYNSEEDEKINGYNFPDLEFDENECKEDWKNIFELDDDSLEKFVNNELEPAETEQEKFDNLQQYLDEDVFTLFLGFHPSFDCKNLQDDQKKDICYLAAGVAKDSTTMCKKITSNSVQSFCAGAVAQSKKKESYCDKVFTGVSDNEAITSLKSVQIRNCYLATSRVTAKSTTDCKSFKKSFLFFFSKSTSTYEACVEGVGKY